MKARISKYAVCLFFIKLVIFSLEPVFGQSLPNFQDELIRAEQVKMSIDTFCSLESAIFHDGYNTKFCGQLRPDSVKIGKWQYYNQFNKLDYISIFDENGNDSLKINWLPSSNTIGAISFLNKNQLVFTVEYFNDTLEFIRKTINDTLSEEIYFYSSGRIKSHGYVYRNRFHSFIKEPLPRIGGIRKHAVWNYFDIEGNLIRTEKYH